MVTYELGGIKDSSSTVRTTATPAASGSAVSRHSTAADAVDVDLSGESKHVAAEVGPITFSASDIGFENAVEKT